MSTPSNIDSLQRYFKARFQEELLPKQKRPPQGPAVTISRETGAGAITLGTKLAGYLETRDGDRESAWTVFDRNLVNKVLEDHKLPGKLAEYMPEDSGNDLAAYVGELLGLHPSITTLVEKTNETIKRLAKAGNVILVGRGGNVVTFSLKNTVHIRLTAPLEKRIERARIYYDLSHKAAAELVEKKDRERADYVRKHFNQRIDDPHLYHMTLNTGLFSDDQAAAVIGDAVLRHAGLLTR